MSDEITETAAQEKADANSRVGVEPVVMRQLTRTELSLLRTINRIGWVWSLKNKGFPISRPLIEESYVNMKPVLNG